MPQVPFSELHYGAHFSVPIQILGNRELVLLKASDHEAIPACDITSGNPTFLDVDKDDFNPEEYVTFPPANYMTG